LFTPVERLIFAAVVVGAGLAAYGLYSGVLAL
jgi:arginine:ornithine antiporter/lysine permease